MERRRWRTHSTVGAEGNISAAEGTAGLGPMKELPGVMGFISAGFVFAKQDPLLMHESVFPQTPFVCRSECVGILPTFLSPLIIDTGQNEMFLVPSSKGSKGSG